MSPKTRSMLLQVLVALSMISVGVVLALTGIGSRCGCDAAAGETARDRALP